jgi:hypothetical protein
MATAVIKEPKDQKKVIMAVALGVLAIIALWWTFFGFGGSSKPQPRASNRAVANASPAPRVVEQISTQPDTTNDSPYVAVIVVPNTPPQVAEPRRNIFAFYVPPTPTPVQVPVAPPSPTPTPPVLLAAVSPANVYARTDDFTLEVTGDKFTPALHVIVDGRELPTRYVSPQQLSAVVPAAMIANAGQRTVVLRSSDGLLFSTQASLNVTAPPTPNYSYVGLLGKPRHIGDTAILQDKTNKEIVTVQRGDVLGGRFRVSSIGDRELVVVDTNLKIKHSIMMTNDADRGSFPQGRPTPRVAAEDDEP